MEAGEAHEERQEFVKRKEGLTSIPAKVCPSSYDHHCMRHVCAGCGAV